MISKKVVLFSCFVGSYFFITKCYGYPSIRYDLGLIPITRLQANVFDASDENLGYMGRFSFSTDRTIASFAWSGCTIYGGFTGTSLAVILQDNVNQYDIMIDGKDFPILKPTNGQSPVSYPVATGLSTAKHTFYLRKRTEAEYNLTPAPSFHGLKLDQNGSTVLFPRKFVSDRRIEIIGDSITSGYGDLGKFPCQESATMQDFFVTYSHLVASKFSADLSVVAWSGKGLVRNYGSPTTTSPDPMPKFYTDTLGTMGQFPWNFATYIPHLVLINLGTNDYFTEPSPSPAVFQQAYINFINTIRQSYSSASVSPQVGLMCGPMIGDICCNSVKAVVATLNAQGDPRVHYLDTITLDNPGDFGCKHHPNIIGHKKMALHLIPQIKAIMSW